MKRWIGIAAFALVLLLVGVGSIFKLYAQATTGYTKVNSAPITGTTFTSGTLVNGGFYNVEITAVNQAGESGPSTIVSGSVPPTGTHTFTVSWTPSSGATSYNVYDQLVAIPNPPGAPQLTIN